MKYTFKENGIRVSFEATMPMEHEQEKFDHLLNIIKRKARSEYANNSSIIVSLSKHDFDNSENVISKCDFTFQQSFLNYSKLLFVF